MYKHEGKREGGIDQRETFVKTRIENEADQQERESEEGGKGRASVPLISSFPSNNERKTHKSIFRATFLTCLPRVTEDGRSADDFPPLDPNPLELFVRFVILSNAPERERNKMT